mmetsp:Transcript_3193/g.9367  ORF Transcript_3193/g.9367 Transcript_3193/m.9367 type:complete len:149 (+) Transcript_3193:238-684(+)
MGGEDKPGLMSNILVGGAVGAIYGSIVSAWIAPPVGKLDGVELSQDALPSLRTMWRHVGGQAAIFAGVAAAFSVGEAVASAATGRDDVVPAICGGASAGLAVGARQKTFGHGAAFVLGFGALTGVLHMAHGSFVQDPEGQARRLSAVR